jgi:CDP-6-deoxy-D-xylo-4-hexulose-3-dehydrase
MSVAPKVRHPLATSTWDARERAAIQRVIESDQYSMAGEVRAFEEQFAAYFGSRYAVMSNSGSSANLLMVAALFYRKDVAQRLRPGDEVIVPAVSWSTTYYPLHQYGLRLKFVDVDLETLNFDLDALADAITDRTRLIFAVNLLGNPNDFTAIERLAASRDIIVIEDNCESMGARFGGRHTGAIGLMGSFSTFFSHHISTMEGGVTVTDDEELYHIMLCLRAHGWTRNLPRQNRVTGTKSDDPFEESFRFVLPGYNLRPLEMEGAIGQEQLRKLPDFIAARRANAAVFQQLLSGHPRLLIQREIGESSWFGFSLVPRPGTGLTRADLRAVLSAEGYEMRPIVAGNFARNPVVGFFDHEIHATLRNADHIDAEGLFIGNHHYPMSESIEHLAAVLARLA